MNQSSEWELEFAGNWPRGLGNPYRTRIARTVEDVVEFAEANKWTNLFATTYHFSEYNDPKTDGCNAVIDCIPFDFDSRDLNVALADAKKINAWAIRHNMTPRVKFSGSKGFHVILNFQTIELNDSKATLKEFGAEISASADLTTVDRVLFGDTNRLLRLTNTIHPKTRLYCIPLDAYKFNDYTLDQILELAKTPQYLDVPAEHIPNNELYEMLKDIDKKFQKRESEPEVDVTQSKLARIFVSQPQGRCRAAEHLVSFGIDEGARDLAISGIIRYYTKLGMSKEDVRKKCVQFSERCPSPLRQSYIDYKLNYHYKSKYTPCAFLKNIDNICNGCAKNI